AFFMEAVWSRFMPVWQQVRTWLDSGAIGEIKIVQANFGFYRDYDDKERLFNPDVGGGALLDVGIYPITFAQWVMREVPVKIYAAAQFAQSRVDGSNSLILHYSNGAMAALNSSIEAVTTQEAWIYGSKGKIHLPFFWRAEEATLFVDDEAEKVRLPHRINGYEYEIEEVNRCISLRQKESETMPISESKNVMTIMDQARAQFGLTYPCEMS
ncbi:MAG: Gfo/Idh/MocA family oxidoreductase, partial [Acidiferrobacterales bacterium]|nr:Gfo/Idh/MocA family oxidoreductase [Acidiferrobacterales bacterium]